MRAKKDLAPRDMARYLDRFAEGRGESLDSQNGFRDVMLVLIWQPKSV